MTPYTTRIAPSPTGMFHLGTARTAYFNYILARASGGKFILRIDDTDVARSNDAYVDVILDAMDWLGLDYDAVYRQSDRLDVYNTAAQKMLDTNCAVRDGDTIRMNPWHWAGKWQDQISGFIKTSPDDVKVIRNLVLVRSNGMPTYHFASIVDDMDMGVNYVIRGTDHISNTAKQLTIQYNLDYDPNNTKDTSIRFAHIGLIDVKVDDKRRKLSKRDGAASVLALRDAGYHPQAVLNFMLRLGWSAADPNFDKHTPLVTKDMAIKLFMTDGKMGNSPVLFDQVKLDWYQKKYTHLLK